MTSQKIPPDNSTGEPEETFFDDPEKWTDEGTPRHAPVPARVFQERSLLIDEALLSRINSPRAPRIRSHLDRDRVIRIGRRALEVAIMEAFSQTELNPRLSEWEPEWSRIADASRAADVALSRLFRAIDPLGKDARAFCPVHQAVARQRWGWGIEGYEGCPAIDGGRADNRQTARRYTDAQRCAFGALP